MYPAVLIGMPAVVVLAALMPAFRARRLPAAVAISAGSAQRAGRGLAVQRRLGGSRLPRAISLGLGWPFARPARTLLTLSAVVAGVTTVTLAIGMAGSTFRFGELHRRTDQVYFTTGSGSPADPAPTHTDAQIDALIRAQPGVLRVAADASVETRIAGSTATIWAGVIRGDYGAIQAPLVQGRWATAPGEVTVDSEYRHQFGLTVGQTIRMLDASGAEVPEKIVGEGPGWHIATPDWQSFIGLNPQGRAATFYVTLAKGADPAAVIAAIGGQDPGLHGAVDGESKTSEKTFLSIITTLTIMLSIVASLGVLNTVVLNTRERRRDLGTLKAIGMTPGQVIAMVVTAMTALGTLGGLIGVPLGILAHRIVIPLTMHGIQEETPDSMLDVWNWAGLVLLTLSGAVIAATGAYLPSIRASRAPVAEVLRTE
ncbi:ABC transporter permease [Catenulispora yoronensis]